MHEILILDELFLSEVYIFVESENVCTELRSCRPGTSHPQSSRASLAGHHDT